MLKNKDKKRAIFTAAVFIVFLPALYSFSVNNTTDADALAAALFDPGTGLTITYASLVPTGTWYPAARFYNGPMSIPDGILLASGEAENALPPDESTGMTTMMGLAGDSALVSQIVGESVSAYDTVVLEIHFDAGPSVNSFSFDFIFGSEEYPEYVNEEFNDCFGVFLNGSQIVYDNTGAPITINGPYFTDADKVRVPPGNGMEYDGSTAVLNTKAPLTSGSTGNILKIVISDVADQKLDSGVLMAGLKGGPDIVTTPVTGPYTPTVTPTLTRTQTFTHSPTITMTHTITPTHTITKTHTVTPTITPTPVDFVMDLEGSFPAPFKDKAKIVYRLSKEAEMEMKFFTVSGEVVNEIRGIEGRRGYNVFVWDGRNSAGREVSSGVYIYRIKARAPGGETAVFTSKVTRVK